MVNAKNVAFKVDKQAPGRARTVQPYATVINCRKPGGKRPKKVNEIKSQQVPLARVAECPSNPSKRKRSSDDEQDLTTPHAKRPCSSQSTSLSASAIGSHTVTPSNHTVTPSNRTSESPRPFPRVRNLPLTATAKFRRGRAVNSTLSNWAWACVFDLTPPDQLLKMRDKVSLCYRTLKQYPHIWRNSRKYWCPALPEPPEELNLNEFQYADLRHGSNCMSCRQAPSTRKTYWAFMRRWCRKCLSLKIIKEQDARVLFRDEQGRDISEIKQCLRSAIFDSWGNYVGVGVGVGTHAASVNKVSYLLSDVEEIVAEYIRLSKEKAATWDIEKRAWMEPKIEAVAVHREFARSMEFWEEGNRTSRTYDYQGKKNARKEFFVEKAASLSPPITLGEMELSKAYKRAIAIPRPPSMNAWLLLKPKLEKEVEDVRAARLAPASHPDSAETTHPVTPARERDLDSLLGELERQRQNLQRFLN